MNDSKPQSGTQVRFELPRQIAASESGLQAAVSRAFLIAPVRSVTIDAARTSAIVRLRRGGAAETSAESDKAIADSLTAALADGETMTTPPIELLSWSDSRDGSLSFIKMPARVTGWRKAMYLVLAATALLLGLLGILLPGLPTTPFVLLGSYFLIRSSTRLHDRLMESRLFGGVLRDWHLHRGLRPHVRARAIAVVAIVVALSLIVARPSWPAIVIVAALVACGLTVIWRLPTVRDNETIRTD